MLQIWRPVPVQVRSPDLIHKHTVTKKHAVKDPGCFALFAGRGAAGPGGLIDPSSRSGRGRPRCLVMNFILIPDYRYFTVNNYSNGG